MSNLDQVYERFQALLQLVEEMHKKCKANHPNVETLIDTFFLFHGLNVSFHKDCESYLTDHPPSLNLLSTVSQIYSGLMCSFMHLQESSERLNTTVLEQIIKKMNFSPDSPNPLEVKPGVN